MESNETEQARQAVRALERAEASPYIDYPSTPRWYPPAAGAWAAGLVAAVAMSQSHRAMSFAMFAVLLALLGAYVAWYSRYHGAVPDLRRPPRELRPAFAWFAVGALLVIGVVALAWWLLGPAVAVGVTFVAVWVGLVGYERRYAAAAAATRDRLA